MTFEETLARVLNPEGIYWGIADEYLDDQAKLRMVQLRIDVPPGRVAEAVSQMEVNGWQFTEQPDEPDDLQQRLFFMRQQNLLPETRRTMLTSALKVVFPIEGARLWTWIIVEDENEK